jgi:predicted RNase H-like nuclease (RuvC/YqgF family)
LYKRKKAELDDIKSERGTLGRTMDILADRWKTLQHELASEGRGIITAETVDLSSQRPKTAKPVTSDVADLKKMTRDLSAVLTEKRADVQRLNDEIDEFSKSHKKSNEEYMATQAQYEVMERELQQEVELVQKVSA